LTPSGAADAVGGDAGHLGTGLVLHRGRDRARLGRTLGNLRPLLADLKQRPDVDTKVLDGTLECRQCVPGAKLRIQAVIGVKSNTRVGAAFSAVVFASSKTNTTKKDVVRARVEVVA
jgi:hypothetical protein